MNEVKVLDHGYVRLLNLAGPEHRPMIYSDDDNIPNHCQVCVNQMRTNECLACIEGSYFQLATCFDADDTDPANVARKSFDQKDSERTREQDLRLATYLMKNRHTTPFEFIQVYLEMKLPIFVARQFVRHRTVSINEVSARYTTLPAEWYVPELEQITGKAQNNKQGRTGDQHQDAVWFKNVLDSQCKNSYALYEEAVAKGIAPELARLFLHVNHYTAWVWSQNLHNLMHFLSLRDHSHAQWEAQQYARAIDTLVRQHLPETMALYDQFRRQP